MFEIHIPDPNVQDGSAPISWCMHPSFVEELTKNDVKDPYVYIIVTPCADEHRVVKERRYAVPLRTMMAYVEFGSHGVNHVFAFVASEQEREKFLEGNQYSRWGKHYIGTSTWRSPEEGEDLRIRLYENKENQFGATRIMVTVPEGVFAKEPPVWLATWVNWLFSLPPIDSCEFQRRMYGVALHVQVLLFLLVYGVRLTGYVVMKLLLMGNVSARPLLHPLTFNVDDLEDGTEGKFHFLPRKWLKGKAWAFWYLPSTPFAAVVVAVIARLAGFDYLSSLVRGVGFSVAWAVFISVVALASKGWAMLREKLSPTESGKRKYEMAVQEKEALWLRKEQERQEELEALYWYRNPSVVAPLVCTSEAPRKPLTRVADLPPELRTFDLRLAEYKAGSCKPYAK